jgi:hypothetical protein
MYQIMPSMVVFADAGVMVLALLFSIVFATSYYTRAKKSIIKESLLS